MSPNAIFEPLEVLDSVDFSGNPGADDFVPNFEVTGSSSVRAHASAEVVGEPQGNPWGTNLLWSWTRTDSESAALTLAGADTATLSFEAPNLAADVDVTFNVIATGRGHTANATKTATVTIEATGSLSALTVTSLPVEGDTYRRAEALEWTATFTERVFGLSQSDRELRLGWRLGLARSEDNVSLDLELEATRRESVNDDREPEHGVGLRLSVRW